ncbi:hypothetical protein PFICI_07780 [Pestalotiopsis fici W106-1]|uniref:N-acetyltransferase domain-containing protein n=1 Tax=Pestalotiopsis fici (strain W106-1 / CGMCC3.15140) TaxID=1229662 RepID=W3X513_PESFW|nr:uncharacterized protein PFICI_07780 [Pestalotiopsis fici W106-1]ETS80251.1 hypothetical protein PFICI_07780 [Pestalotiopsis fici W106-1]
MLLGRDPDTFKGLLSKSIETWMSDPNAQLIKAVATNEEDIVGYACWVTEDAAPEAKHNPTKPESVSKTVGEQQPQEITGANDNDSVRHAAPDLQQQKPLPQDLGKLMRQDLVARKRELVGNERHLVLQALVTDPQWQNRGIGAQLVRWGTIRADVEGLACWAHASPSGFGVYLRAGFQELGSSEYALDDYLPESEQGKSQWGTYTFRYMVRRSKAGND